MHMITLHIASIIVVCVMIIKVFIKAVIRGQMMWMTQAASAKLAAKSRCRVELPSSELIEVMSTQWRRRQHCGLRDRWQKVWYWWRERRLDRGWTEVIRSCAITDHVALLPAVVVQLLRTLVPWPGEVSSVQVLETGTGRLKADSWTSGEVRLIVLVCMLV